MMLRREMLEVSRRKFIPPYTLDERLTFYCPQENLEAFEIPIIKEYHMFLLSEYTPPPCPEKPILLLLPCTKTKPYAFSREHQAINKYLLEQGFEPVGEGDCPEEALLALGGTVEARLVNNSLLKRGTCWVHRMVVSEPMGLVPYEFIYHYRGQLSQFSRYDDPGLFEHRGNTVCVWRADHTGRLVKGRYRWGPNERAAYVETHNRLVELIATVLNRLRPHYRKIVAYVSPKMTHRSFLASVEEKRQRGIPITRKTQRGVARLAGVNDLVPGLVTVVPSWAEIQEIVGNLSTRLGACCQDKPLTRQQVRAYFASGGGVATPLVLPETLSVLSRYLS
jgi:hypothetical protein